MITVATTQYCIENMQNWQQYVDKITSLVEQAKKRGAQLLLLPEYAGIEMINEAQDDANLFAKLQPLIPDYIALFQSLAHQYQLYIQAGTVLVKHDPAHFFNRAYFFGPDKSYGYQDKLNLVTDEKGAQLLVPGNGQTIFETALGPIGIVVCYDSEFPELVRNFTQAGVQLILVPSYTPSKASFMRVQLSCRARALENQCYVLLSSIVDKVNFAGDIEHLVGQAALFTPVDNGFNDDGIHAQGKMNKSELLIADISFDKINEVRRKGQVHNFHDYENLKKHQSLSKLKL